MDKVYGISHAFLVGVMSTSQYQVDIQAEQLVQTSKVTVLYSSAPPVNIVQRRISSQVASRVLPVMAWIKKKIKRGHECIPYY